MLWFPETTLVACYIGDQVAPTLRKAAPDDMRVQIRLFTSAVRASTVARASLAVVLGLAVSERRVEETGPVAITRTRDPTARCSYRLTEETGYIPCRNCNL